MDTDAGSFDENTMEFDEDSRTCDDKSSESAVSECGGTSKMYKYKGIFPDSAECSYCKATLTSRQEAKSHMRKAHAGETMFQCPHCSYRFRHKSRFLRHVSNLHKTKQVSEKTNGRKRSYNPSNIKYSKCRFCFMELSKKNVQTHLSTYHRINYKPYCCVYCIFKTDHLLNLSSHVQKEHTDLKKFSCTYCSYKCFKLNYLKRHTLSRHKKETKDLTEEEIMGQVEEANESEISSDEGGCNYSCEQCSYVAPNTKLLSRHVVQVHEQKCWTVSKIDLVNSKFEQIKKEEDPTEIKPEIKADKETYKCAKCDFVTIHLSLYNEHVACAHNYNDGKQQGPFYCKYCSFSTVYAHSVKRHYETVHFKVNRKVEVVKAYQCDYCRDIFELKIRLRRHVERVHDIDNPYNCSICDYRASTREQLHKHMGLHA